MAFSPGILAPADGAARSIPSNPLRLADVSSNDCNARPSTHQFKARRDDNDKIRPKKRNGREAVSSSGVVMASASSPMVLSPSAHSTSLSTSSRGGSTSMSTSTPAPTPATKIVLVGDEIDEKIEIHARKFGLPVERSRDAAEYLDSEELHDAAFVLKDFSGDAFDNLDSRKACILGPTALAELSLEDDAPGETNPALYLSSRPLYCTSMRGLGVCFSGYRAKENKRDLRRFLFLIHCMGGRVLADVTAKSSNKSNVTHLVAKECRGEKYTYAATFDIPVMEDAWIENAWRMRTHAGFCADEQGFRSLYKVKPFHGAQVHFVGFSPDEQRHMIDELLRNGGRECEDYRSRPESESPSPCTHIVVDDSVTAMPSEIPRETHVVKAEWFWASIQMDACAEERMHLFSDSLASSAYQSPRANSALFSPATPGSNNRRKKRRTEAVRQLAQSDGGAALLSKKARSSLGGELAALSGSLVLDTPDKTKKQPQGTESTLLFDSAAVSTSPHPAPPVRSPPVTVAATSPEETRRNPISARHQVFAELVQTEENYVNILKTIVTVFKVPLEEDPKIQQLLNQTQMKLIFGNVPPILTAHSQMLADLQKLLIDWSESARIGDIISMHAGALKRAYPPFVNFFEQTKRTLEECDRTNPRFHAFLKVCQSRRECGRQTLAELLIRPVQRLGSISLLLNDLLKHTRKERDHPDTPALEDALSKIKEVLVNINEDKRKTEGQVHIFEIFSDIENCPPHLVSSHRNFLCKVDVAELGGSDELCGKGSELTLFLFTDVLEISKRRRNTGKGGGSGLSARSPSTISLRNPSIVTLGPGGGGVGGSQMGRPHKHVDLMSLSAVRRVVDLVGDEDCKDCFTLVCRTNQELKERMFVFQLLSLGDDAVAPPPNAKADFLRLLCRNVANTMYRQDPEAYLVQMRPDDLGLAPSDLLVTGGVGRAYRSLHRVKKAFSFNRTPTTSRLTRAVSSMISPLTSHNSIGRGGNNAGSVTPSGDLQRMRLQSCSNLLEAEVGSSPKLPRDGRTTPVRGARAFPMAPPPPASPVRSLPPPESPRSDRSGGFSVPRTPTMCARRASFKFLSNSLGKKRKE